MREMEFLSLSRTFSVFLHLKTETTQKSLGFLMTQTPYEFRDHNPR